MYELLELQELDNFNVLYVALTRAREQLYVISNKKENSKAELPLGSFQYYFRAFIQQSHFFTDNNDSYSIGEKARGSVDTDLNKLKKEIVFTANNKQHNGISTIVSQQVVSNEHKTLIDWGNPALSKNMS